MNSKKAFILILISFIIFSIGVPLYEIMHNIQLLMMFFCGISMMYVSYQMTYLSKFLRNLTMMFGVILLLLSGFSTKGIWIVLLSCVLIFFFIFQWIFGQKSSFTSSLFNQIPWRKKRYEAIKTLEPSPEIKRKKFQWLGQEIVGETAYEWDNINIVFLFGDRIIDLGNTILPEKDNHIIIRGAIGRVRVIVPVGVGITLHHSSLVGEGLFEQEKFHLHNESVVLRSKNYPESTKHIHLLTSILVGEIEVIQL